MNPHDRHGYLASEDVACAYSSCKAVVAGFKGKHGSSVCFADGDRFGVIVDGDQRYTFDCCKSAMVFARKRAFEAPQVAA